MTAQRLATTVLLTLGLAALTFGVVVRFVQLDRQTIFADEVATQLRVSGVTQPDMTGFFDDRPSTVGRWRARYIVAPSGGALGVVRSLASEEPQWTPLFYLASYAVERLTDGGIIADRALAAVFGVATIAAMAWFALELFGSVAVAALTGVFAAISPLLVAYSREARGYALLTLIIAFSSAALLRSAKTQRLSYWALYGASVLAGVATYSLFATVVVGHGIWLVVTRRRLRPFLLASMPAVIFGVSWFAYGAHRRSWIGGLLPTDGHYGLWTFIIPKWLYNLALPFYSLDVWNVALGFLVIPIVLALAFAVVIIARRPAGRSALLFLAAMALPTTALLLAFDSHWNKSLTLEVRYEFPLWLALLVVVAAMSAELLTRRLSARQMIGAAIACTLLTLTSVSSTVAVVGAPWWWDTWFNADVPSIVHAINSSRDPLVITSAAVAPEDVFANGLRPDVAVLPLSLAVFNRCRVVRVDTKKHSVFVLARPDSLLRQPRRQGDAELVPIVATLEQASIAWRFRRWADGLTGRASRRGWPDQWETYELWSVQDDSLRSPPFAIDICP